MQYKKAPLTTKPLINIGKPLISALCIMLCSANLLSAQHSISLYYGMMDPLDAFESSETFESHFLLCATATDLPDEPILFTLITSYKIPAHWEQETPSPEEAAKLQQSIHSHLTLPAEATTSNSEQNTDSSFTIYRFRADDPLFKQCCSSLHTSVEQYSELKLPLGSQMIPLSHVPLILQHLEQKDYGHIFILDKEGHYTATNHQLENIEQVYELVKILRQHTPIETALELCPSQNNQAQSLAKAPFADQVYSSRKAQELSAEEQAIVGKWAAQNREVQWEIERFPDGTYQIVIMGVMEKDDWIDFGRGIWGIKDGSYFYSELESSWLDTEFALTPEYEKVVISTDTEFTTSRPGVDGEILYSRELKVGQFSMPLWDTYHP